MQRLWLVPVLTWLNGMAHTSWIDPALIPDTSIRFDCTRAYERACARLRLSPGQMTHDSRRGCLQRLDKADMYWRQGTYRLV